MAACHLFINKKKRLPIGVWMEAEEHNTKGFAFRPGWHCTSHLSSTGTKGGVWVEVEVDDYLREQTRVSRWNLVVSGYEIIKNINECTKFI